jgi:DNA-directed RNA polymerase specialized sigma24 family protein
VLRSEPAWRVTTSCQPVFEKVLELFVTWLLDPDLRKCVDWFAGRRDSGMRAGGQAGGQPPRPVEPDDLKPDDPDVDDLSPEVDADTFDACGFADEMPIETEELDDTQQDVTATLLAEQLERRMEDRHLVEDLRSQNFAGPRYEVLAADLAAYGLVVTTSWIRRRIIYRKSAERGRPVTCPEFVREHLALDRDDRGELALETVAHALVFFRDYALVRGKWSPRGGAGLRSFFQGACVAVFANVFRTWHREFQDGLRALTYGLSHKLDEERSSLTSSVLNADPADTVAGAQWLDCELAKIKNSHLRYALEAVALHESTYAEIGDELGLSADAVKMMLYRYRQESRRRQGRRGQGDRSGYE